MFSVSKNGRALEKSKYSWDEAAKVFGSTETGVVLDFSDYSGATFNTGTYCTFKTGSGCTFNTGDGCTFNVGEKCCLHYTWNDCFEVYKLPEGKLVKILGSGKLEDVKKMWLKRNLKFLKTALENPGWCLVHVDNKN